MMNGNDRMMLADQEKGEMVRSQSESDDLRGAWSYTEARQSGGLRYVSSIYYFSIETPGSWGEELYEQMGQNPGAPFEAVVNVYPGSDVNNGVTIYVVKEALASDPMVTSLPAEKVGQVAGKYVYYMSTQGDAYGRPGVESEADRRMFEEGNIIRDSFTTSL